MSAIISATSDPSVVAAAAATRPFFKLKSQWASWEADQIGKTISKMRSERLPSADWRGIRRKSEAINRLESNRRDWERRADYYRLQESGVNQPARRYGGARPFATGYR